MNDRLLYNAWTHGDARTEPASEDAEIIGLELEIARVNSGEYAGWNQAIEDGILETSDSSTAFIQLEEEAQSDVQFELIFNADSVGNILERLDELNSYVEGTFSNHRETSCHIHINREWLDNLNITENAFLRATEAIAPLIYTISGRDSTSWNRWSHSQIELDEYRGDLIERLQSTQETEADYQTDSRYYLCNCHNRDTIEIRGFSNYYDNNINYITGYIKIVTELIPAIAGYYGETSYYEDPDYLFETVEAFLEDNSSYYQAFSIGSWKGYEAKKLAIKRAKYEKAITTFQEVQNNLNRARQNASYDKLEASTFILRAIRAEPAITPTSINLENPLQTINELEEANQKHFKNKIWRL